MMLLDDLKRIAQMKNLPLRNAEKDYMLDICLFALSRQRSVLAFKGGTALYKFHNLNRFSEDLDFTLNKKRLAMYKICSDIISTYGYLGINAQIGEPKRFKNEVNVAINLRGPLFDGSRESLCRTAINISLRERPVHVETKLYIPVYTELQSFELHIIGIDELLAEKVRAIMTRDKPRDVYDAWFLLRKGTKPDLLLINKKLKIYAMKFNKDDFFEHIENKRKAWKKDLQGLMIGTLPGFDIISDEIRTRLNEMVL